MFKNMGQVWANSSILFILLCRLGDEDVGEGDGDDDGEII